MTNYVWKSAISGDWATTLDWTPAGLPNAATANVLIEAPGTYAVSIDPADLGYIAGDVTLAAGAATLAIGAGLTLAGASHSLAVQAGQVVVESGATLAGAAVTLTGGSLSFGNNATLDGDSISGRLALDGQEVTVIDGLTLSNPGGGAGTIDLLTYGSELVSGDNETLDHVAVLVGAFGALVAGGEGTDALTLGTHASVVQTYGSLFVGGSSIVNDGQFILADGTVNESAAEFTNAASGTMMLSNGDRLQAYGDFDNAGTLEIGAGSVFTANVGLINTGVIIVDAGGTLAVPSGFAGSLGTIVNSGVVSAAGSYDLADLAGLTGAGSLDLTGTLDLSGGTLDVAANGALSNISLNGEVTDGTIRQDGGSLSLSNATLDGVTYIGTLVAPASSDLNLSGGLVVEDASGAASGTIDLTGYYADLTVLDNETLDHVTLQLGNVAATSYLYTYDTLVLGSDVTGVQTQGTLYLVGEQAGALLVNDGVLSLAADMSMTLPRSRTRARLLCSRASRLPRLTEQA